MEFKYAPGLPGYGTQGIDGSNGLLGISTYFSDFDGITDATQITARINANKILFAADEFIPGYPDRVYQTGDMFVDKNGRVYEIDLDLGQNFSDTGSRLNTSTIFVEGIDTEVSPTYTRYSNSFGAEKFLVDNVYVSGTVNNYALAPESGDGVYGIGAVDYAQIKYVDNSINGSSDFYHPYTIWSNTNDVLTPEKAIALVKVADEDHWRLGNLDGGGALRDVDFSLDFANLNVEGESLFKDDVIISKNTSSYRAPLLTIKNTASSADAAMKFEISGDAYTLGIDNSDTDRFKLCYGNELTSTDSSIIFEHYQSTISYARNNKFYDNLEIEVTRDTGGSANDPCFILDANGKSGTPADSSTHTSMLYSGTRSVTMGINANTPNDAWGMYSGTSLPTLFTDDNRDDHSLSFDGFTKASGIGDPDGLWNATAKLTIVTRGVGDGNPNGSGFSYGLRVRNDFRNTNAAKGIKVECGEDVPTGNNIVLDSYDGDGTQTGYLVNTAAGGFSIISISDERKKMGIVDASIDALGILADLPVREFWWRDRDGSTVLDTSVGEKIIGYIAQEASIAYPNMSDYQEEGDSWGIAPLHIIPILHKSILEQQAKIIELENKDASTQSLIGSLISRIEALEA